MKKKITPERRKYVVYKYAARVSISLESDFRVILEFSLLIEADSGELDLNLLQEQAAVRHIPPVLQYV